jgi:hypothetical protein
MRTGNHSLVDEQVQPEERQKAEVDGHEDRKCTNRSINIPMRTGIHQSEQECTFSWMNMCSPKSVRKRK